MNNPIIWLFIILLRTEHLHTNSQEETSEEIYEQKPDAALPEPSHQVEVNIE
jgi:hypothetical protein